MSQTDLEMGLEMGLEIDLEVEWIELAGHSGLLRRFKRPHPSAIPPRAESNPYLTSLNPDQEAELSAIQKKWNAIASTTPIDRSQAETAVQALYHHLGLAPPTLHFFASPAGALQFLREKAQQQAEQTLPAKAQRRSHALTRQIWKAVAADWKQIVRSQFMQNLKATLREAFEQAILKGSAADLDPTLALEQAFHSEPFSEPCFATQEQRNLAYFAALRTCIDLLQEFLQGDAFKALRAAERQNLRGTGKVFTQMPTEGPVLKAVVQQRKQSLLWQTIEQVWGEELSLVWDRKLQHPLRHQFQACVAPEIQDQNSPMQRLQQHIRHVSRLLRQTLQPELGDRLPINAGSELYDACWLEFGFSSLNLPGDRDQWQIFHNLVVSCGWVFAFEKVCLVCDRPTQLGFNHRAQLHATGRPAVQFADGFSLYAYESVLLPPHYGQIPPEQWQSHWILRESNTELRRLLIRAIGYARLSEELQTKELNTWQGYTLLQMTDYVDDEPIHLLKMACPSTGSTYILRVPPDLESARAAIQWVNWGIDPLEFAAQT